MSIYFAWVSEDDIFDPDRHLRMDEDIFSLTITGREGDFPTAEGEFALPLKNFDGGKPYAMITYVHGGQPTVLLKGRLLTAPHMPSALWMGLRFVAAPSDPSTAGLQGIMTTLKGQGHYHPLFVPTAYQDCPAEGIDAIPYLYFWDPRTLQVKLSHICAGRAHIPIHTNYFADSFRLKQTQQPLERMTVRLSVPWTQRHVGTADIAPVIAGCFPHGRVSTLTGSHLKTHWFHHHTPLKETGYWIEDSWIKEYTPPKTGALNLYPVLTEPLWVDKDDPQGNGREPCQIRLKRSWFQTRLVVGFDYKQKRKEVAEITLCQKTSLSSGVAGKSRQVTIHLNDLSLYSARNVFKPQWRYSKGFCLEHGGILYRCLKTHLSGDRFEADKGFWHALGPGDRLPYETHFSSFFQTDQGRDAILHGAKIARTHLLSSARSVTIGFETPIETVLPITVDHTLSLVHPHHMKRRLRGKVKMYRFIFHGDRGVCYARVELAAIPGVKKESKKGMPPPMADHVWAEDVADPDVCAPIDPIFLGDEEGGGIALSPWAHQRPTDDGCCPENWRGADLVEQITVNHHADQQEQWLRQNQYPVSRHLAATLAEKPTHITVHLKDLRPHTVLINRLCITGREPLSYPAHIDGADLVDVLTMPRKPRDS